MRQCFQAHDVILGVVLWFGLTEPSPDPSNWGYDLMINPDLAKWFSSINLLSCTYTADASETYSCKICRHSSVLIMDYCPRVSVFFMAALSQKTLNRPHTGFGIFSLFFFFLREHSAAHCFYLVVMYNVFSLQQGFHVFLTMLSLGTWCQEERISGKETFYWRGGEKRHDRREHCRREK